MKEGIRRLTESWGSTESVDLYLDRCQVDTPAWVVQKVWELVERRRESINLVVDFGAGDGRFAHFGHYGSYVGFEIDKSRAVGGEPLPKAAAIRYSCAFAEAHLEADLCIGNPPYVRNQDLPRGWRVQAAAVVRERTHIEISGLANAWQYFAFLALSVTQKDGLIALVIPYEWVSRPSSNALRAFVRSHGWDVSVFRLTDDAFPHVLTTSSITLIDKRGATGLWQYFEQQANGDFEPLATPSGGVDGVISYSKNAVLPSHDVKVTRGLSPGNQTIFTLTETQRSQHNLMIGEDVVRCVTTLRPLKADCKVLSHRVFDERYVTAGEKCWLICPHTVPSPQLQAYLSQVPELERNTKTCLGREDWWRFSMPSPPTVMIATGFRHRRPKAVFNSVSAVAVGVVAGVSGLPVVKARSLIKAIHAADFDDRVVSHSHGLRKLEIGQLKTFVSSVLQRKD